MYLLMVPKMPGTSSKYFTYITSLNSTNSMCLKKLVSSYRWGTDSSVNLPKVILLESSQSLKKFFF